MKIKKTTNESLAVATKQLSSMIRTGLPLLDSLNIISDTSENATIQYAFKEIGLGISKGATMSEMLEKYPEVFNEMYRALVNAGETAGLLQQLLTVRLNCLKVLPKLKVRLEVQCLIQ